MFRWIASVLSLLLMTLGVVEAETKTFAWEMSYITASPNGVERPVIGVNGHFPPPTIFVSKNDQVVIQVTNSLNDGEFVTLHTHGIFQNGTNYFDGVNQFTQWSSSSGRNLIIAGYPVDSHLNIISTLENKLEHIGFTPMSKDNILMVFVHHLLSSILILRIRLTSN
jgi:hypothetical protein